MPKETIRSIGSPFIKLDDGNEVPPDSPLVPKDSGGHPVLQRGITVRWGREKEVEIGVHEFEISTGAIRSGHFSRFDRDGLQALIRTTKKARDQAFGKDE